MASEAEPRPRAKVEQPGTSTCVWQEFLSTELCCPVRVVYTRARRTPLQVRPLSSTDAREGSRRASSSRGAHRGTNRSPGPSGLEVRMHSMFVAAPPPVHEAVVRWIRSGRRAPRACALLDRWIMESLERLPLDGLREVPLRARGEHHDLAALASELLRIEFAVELAARPEPPRVTWGRKGQSRTRHSLRLGSFDPEGSIVRIHPVLDQAAVPQWFVRYVLFHELLHAALPPRPGRGSRWIHHGAEFRKRERAYPDYPRATAWEKAHMTELIRSARRTTPMRCKEITPIEAQCSASAAQSSRSKADVAPCVEHVREPRPKKEPPALVRLFQEWLFPQ